MRALVTGGSGFVGSHLVRALQERGVEVRCLVRRSSSALALDGVRVERVVGDLRDVESVRRATHGCDTVYHCAADYRLYVPDSRAMYETNVQGTRNVLQAAAECAVRRVVYTSTVGALGLMRDGQPADEQTPVSSGHMLGHYKRSKYLAQQVAEEWAERGLPVVIVNPSTPIGERDVKPTATGQMIVDFLLGRMRAYVDTGLNLIDVRDVAQGHILAAEKGRVGQKYILGHRNMSLMEIFQVLSSLSGKAVPKLRLPHWVPLTFSAVDTSWAKLTRGQPRVAFDAVRLSRHTMFFDSSKAVRELGLPQSPVEDALQRAAAWFGQSGYLAGAAS